MNEKLSQFAARLREEILSTPPDPGGGAPWHGDFFNTRACELFALQFEQNPAYRIFCQGRKVTPGSVNHWSQIPAVPTAAFKELSLSCLGAGERTTVFHSSGTTELRPSRHFHNAASLAVYETSLLAWFRAHQGHQRRHLILTPPPAQAGHSSLVYMFNTLRVSAAEPESRFAGGRDANGDWRVNFPTALGIMREAIAAETPLLLLGTAFSFVHLLDHLDQHDLAFRLPPNSAALETGGYKGRSRAIPKRELHELITAQLGIPPARILCEYGMSELSSQAYQGNLRDGDGANGVDVFRFAPWARAQVISPETGLEVPVGGTGLIRVFDLANVFSVQAIQTEDLAIRRGTGFELLGRAAAAEPRGCSLMTEATMKH